jgi:hypothetical protein
MPNSNLELLKQVAKRLGPLLTEVVFVGGCTTGLFLTDEAAKGPLPWNARFPAKWITS